MKKKAVYRAPKGWLTTMQVLEVLGLSRSTLYRVYPTIFSESETIIFHKKRIFKEARALDYLKEQIQACS